MAVAEAALVLTVVATVEEVEVVSAIVEEVEVADFKIQAPIPLPLDDAQYGQGENTKKIPVGQSAIHGDVGVGSRISKATFWMPVERTRSRT